MALNQGTVNGSKGRNRMKIATLGILLFVTLIVIIGLFDIIRTWSSGGIQLTAAEGRRKLTKLSGKPLPANIEVSRAVEDDIYHDSYLWVLHSNGNIDWVSVDSNSSSNEEFFREHVGQNNVRIFQVSTGDFKNGSSYFAVKKFLTSDGYFWTVICTTR